MKRVDEIIYGSLSRPMGPTGTINRIIKNAEYFKNGGYEVKVFSSDTFKTLDENGKNKITQSKQFSLIKKIVRKFRKKSKILGIILLKREQRMLYSVVEEYCSLRRDVDVTVFHSVETCYRFLRRNNSKSKVVLFFHSDAIPFKMELYNYPQLEGSIVEKKYLKRLKYVLSKVDYFVFIAKTGYDNFRRLHEWISQDKCYLMLNGIEDYTQEEIQNIKFINKSQCPKWKYRLCCVGSINGRKGQDIILNSLIKINNSILRQIHLLLIGDGAEKENLVKFVRDNNLDNNVEFIGFVQNKDIYKYLHKSNIYILMSHNEGLPISIIEAERAGLPIISTNVSGIPELVVTEGDESNGIIINPCEEELIRVLNKINQIDWTQMGYNSRRLYERKFTFDRMRKEYLDMLNIVTK